MDKKENTNNEKGKVAVFVKKATDISKKVATGVKNSATALSEKKKVVDYEKKLKKYNPLFSKQYQSKSFNIPNMVVIVDDAERRGIDVCEGAIGWRDNSSGIEVLYLYDEWVEKSGIEFIPCASCDAAYYVDNFNRKRFLRVDCIFGKAHEEKIAELEHIAYCLGAKSCSIEIVETTEEVSSYKRKANSNTNLVIASSGKSLEKSINSKSSHHRSGKLVTYFEGNDTPQRPTLKWYAHDDNVIGLIEMRCCGDNAIKSKTLELSGSFSATMSQKTANSIDATLKKIGSTASITMEKQAIKENSSKLIFEIEF